VRRAGRFRAPTARVAAVLGVAAFLGFALLYQDRGSVERANRLYREGRTTESTELYRRLAPELARSPEGAYNLGTALLDQDPEESGIRLGVAAAGADSAASHRASYNLGYRALAGVGRSTEPDSAVVLLDAAVAHNRLALRKDPGDDRARWNLALAQRMLDSIARNAEDLFRQDQSGEDETRIDLTTLVRSELGEGVSGPEPEQPPPTESQGLRRGAALGASEAWTSQDPGPLTLEEARRLLGEVEDPPERLVRGLLWSLRPEVAWWASEAYPGGAW